MATCPHCHEFLSDGHSCDASRRRRVRRLTIVVATAVGAGLLVFVVLEDALWGLSAGVITWMAMNALWRQ
jgi:hypothetical protein